MIQLAVHTYQIWLKKKKVIFMSPIQHRESARNRTLGTEGRAQKPSKAPGLFSKWNQKKLAFLQRQLCCTLSTAQDLKENKLDNKTSHWNKEGYGIYRDAPIPISVLIPDTPTRTHKICADPATQIKKKKSNNFIMGLITHYMA